MKGDKYYLIEGYFDRLDEAVKDSGLSKIEIARRCGFDRKCLINRFYMMTSYHLAKFCGVTGVSADWMLGLSRTKERK